MLFAIEGYGGESGARVFERMRRLAGHLDGDETRLRAMEGELAVLTMRADFTTARTLSEEMLSSPSGSVIRRRSPTRA